MIKKANEFLKNFKEKKIIVGLSGGADSVALILNMLNLNIIAVHVNHNMRGEESNQDEEFSINLCKKLDIPIEVYRYRDICMQSEEQARNFRHTCLEDARKKHNADHIALAHNQEDNAETILMNLFRGSGLLGLCGIRPIKKIYIYPLLEVSRNEIESFLKKANQDYITDSTNASYKYTRNRIRHTIFPNINKNAASNITAAAKMLCDDSDLLESLAMEAFNELSHITESEIKINANLMNKPLPIIRRVIRIAIKRLRKNKLVDITNTHINIAIDLLNKNTGRSANIPGLFLYKEYDTIIIKNKIKYFSGYSYKVAPEVEVFVKEINKYFLLTKEPKKNSCKVSINCDKVSGLVVRSRLPGDRIKLSIGTKKLKDYFIDKKTPKDIRESTALLANGSEILWIENGDVHANNSNNIFYICISEVNNG